MSERADHDDADRAEESPAAPKPGTDDESLEDILKPWSLDDFRLDLDGSIDTDGEFGWSRGT